MTRRVLLIFGILSPALYALADAITGSLTVGYSFLHQTISELGAIGAPNRTLFSILLIPVYLLLTAFGAGVWKSAGRNRSLKAAAALIIAFGVIALIAGPFVSMRERGTEQELAGALHLAEGAVEMVILITAMGFAAYGLGWRFALYTIATLVVMLFFGFWSAMDIPVVEAGDPTPWIGVKERIFWYSYQLWFAVLAVILIRRKPL